jgi:hypothetical protein
MVTACWISTHRDMWYAEMPFVFHILPQQYEFVWNLAWTAVQWVCDAHWRIALQRIVAVTDGLSCSAL